MKNYIRTDTNNIIIDSYSTAYRQPVDGDIEIKNSNERHYTLDIIDNNGVYQLKWENGEIVQRSETEKETEIIYTQTCGELAQLDQKITRADEDIIDILISKGVITENDLPKELKDNYILKKEKRNLL